MEMKTEGQEWSSFDSFEQREEFRKFLNERKIEITNCGQSINGKPNNFILKITFNKKAVKVVSLGIMEKEIQLKSCLSNIFSKATSPVEHYASLKIPFEFKE